MLGEGREVSKGGMLQNTREVPARQVKEERRRSPDRHASLNSSRRPPRGAVNSGGKVAGACRKPGRKEEGGGMSSADGTANVKGQCHQHGTLAAQRNTLPVDRERQFPTRTAALGDDGKHVGCGAPQQGAAEEAHDSGEEAAPGGPVLSQLAQQVLQRQRQRGAQGQV